MEIAVRKSMRIHKDSSEHEEREYHKRYGCPFKW